MLLKTLGRLTIAPHSHGKALLQSAVLTSVPVMFGHLAILVASALIPKLLPDRTLEESFTTFATDGSIMATWNIEGKKVIWSVSG